MPRWLLAAILVANREARMASKNKGNKNIKKAPAKSLKQKRLEKKGKASPPTSGDQVRNS